MMERLFFKSDILGPIAFWTTPHGNIDYSALGVEFGLDPFTIKLCGDRFPTSGLRTDATWTQIKDALGVPVVGTEKFPVLVDGRPISEGPTEGALSSNWSGVRTRRRSASITHRLSSRVCTMRKGTVHGVCRLILEKGALLLRAPPQTGKSFLLDLIMGLESGLAFKRVFYISLELLSSGRTFDYLWEFYVGGGISFGDILKSPNSSPEGKHKQQASQEHRPPFLLLVDEGQVGFDTDLELWQVLKSVQSGKLPHLCILIVSALGSNDSVVHTVATPISWGSDSVVGLWPTQVTPVGLQLPVEEAMELWGSWSLGAGLSDSIRDYIFHITDRQPGLLTHVMDWLEDMKLSNIPFEQHAEKIRENLLSLDFCDGLSSIRSIVRLSKGIAAGEHVKPLREFVRVLLQKCEVSYGRLTEEQIVGAQLALKWGQVTEYNDNGGRTLKLPSRLHEMYFMKQLYYHKSKVVYSDGLEAFVRQVVERMNPGQLNYSVSRTVTDERLYERQYQAEFYRAALTVLPMDSWLSPDAGKLLGVEGYIDFYLSEPYCWGFKLLRDGNRLQEHLERFKLGGTYSGLLLNGCIKEYVILDFGMKCLYEHIRVADEHLIHVVFGDDFKTAHLSGSGLRNGSYSIVIGDAGLCT